MGKSWQIEIEEIFTRKCEDAMKERIESIFREVMEIADDVELQDDMSSDNIEEWDSLASMSLVMSLEKEFDVKLKFDDILQMDSLGAVKRVIEGKVQ